MELILINAKQVEWLVVNQPETEYSFTYEGVTLLSPFPFATYDLIVAIRGKTTYYLTPATYDSLATEFKQLADA